MAGKSLAMIFEKPSTRTRISFEIGMRELGGDVVVMERTGSHLGRGESIADTARVLSRYVDVIMIRTTDHKALSELAERIHRIGPDRGLSRIHAETYGMGVQTAKLNLADCQENRIPSSRGDGLFRKIHQLRHQVKMPFCACNRFSASSQTTD